MEKQQFVSDEDLALRFKETGDQESFSLIVTRHRDPILKKCLGYVKDKDAAQDLCQEVLIKLFLKLKSYQNQAKFSTWLFSVIHNTSIDYLRKNKRNVENVLVDKLKNKLADIVEDDEDIPDELSIQILDELLQQLPTEDRLLLVMKYREGHQIKDIQKVMNLSESAVKMRLKRARTRIEKLHQKYKR